MPGLSKKTNICIHIYIYIYIYMKLKKKQIDDAFILTGLFYDYSLIRG